MIKIVFKYLKHVLTARHSYGFGIHSPLIFRFVRNVVYEKNEYYAFEVIEKLRKELHNDTKSVEVKDFGTGESKPKKIAEIAQKSLKRAKSARLLYRTVNFVKPETILELGTSLGITTCYLAAYSEKCKCTTIEGCPEIARIAEKNFKELKYNNITLLNGEIDKILPGFLAGTDTLDFVFIDANHTSTALISYFNQCVTKASSVSVFVVDDIHWSDDMESGWKYIQNHSSVKTTIDVFDMGIVFFNADLNKQHYRLCY